MIFRVNMSTKEVVKQTLPDNYFLFGGRGLTSRILYDEVNPTCEALGPNNKLIIAPGLLGGTAAPCSGRLSIGAKSPLTGGIKESNAGGTAAGKLARLNIRALIIEDKPNDDNLYILVISINKIEVMPATELNGLGNYETSKILFNRFGTRNSIISIGPSGERGYSISTIAITDMKGIPCRHCGRGGLGSVMGSKGLKAIVIDDSNGSKIAYEQEKSFKELSKEWAKELIIKRKFFTKYGTAGNLSIINELGCLPTRNFSSGVFEDAEKISGESLVQLIEKRGGKTSHACHPGCVIRCSNSYKDEDGNVLTSSLEYETIALLGSNCGINDFDFIAKMDRFCDDFGIDTIELGITIGVIMESGIISFGDTEKMYGLTEELRNNTILGKLIGQGATITGKVLNVRRVPAVKGQGLAAYDPRGLPGTGVTYATSPMGGDHTAGNCLPGRTGFRPETKNLNYIETKKGVVELSKDIQTLIVLCDNFGFCFFVGPETEMANKSAKFINYRWGTSINFDDLINLSNQILKYEIEFNEKAGIPQYINSLPEFFSTEKLGSKNYIFDIPKELLVNIFKID